MEKCEEGGGGGGALVIANSVCTPGERCTRKRHASNAGSVVMMTVGAAAAAASPLAHTRICVCVDVAWPCVDYTRIATSRNRAIDDTLEYTRYILYSASWLYSGGVSCLWHTSEQPKPREQISDAQLRQSGVGHVSSVGSFRIAIVHISGRRVHLQQSAYFVWKSRTSFSSWTSSPSTVRFKIIIITLAQVAWCRCRCDDGLNNTCANVCVFHVNG